jgi:hypothetical protein
MKWWRETAAGEASIPTELKTKVDRLFCEFRSLDDTYLKILDGLGFSRVSQAIPIVKRRPVTARHRSGSLANEAPTKKTS